MKREGNHSLEIEQFPKKKALLFSIKHHTCCSLRNPVHYLKAKITLW